MATLSLSLPVAMKRWIDERVASGEWGTASEYVRSLLRADQLARAGAGIEAAIFEGLRSPLHEANASDVRQRLEPRARRGRPPGSGRKNVSGRSGARG